MLISDAEERVNGSPSNASERRWETIEGSLRTVLSPELEVVERIGGGDTTAVFLAREPGLQRLVAIKVLSPANAQEEKIRARFLRDARSIARISHPNVVSLYRIDTILDDVPFVVMQYVRGQSLADRLQSGGPLSLVEARAVLLDVASALGAAHERGILHRDLNPSNVLLEEATGQVFLTDFGLALLLGDVTDVGERITTRGHVVGNLRYLSPEQIKGDEAGERADIWGFGVLAWEVLAGRGPFDEESLAETLRAGLEGSSHDLTAIVPGISSSEATLFARCLATDPGKRPTADEIVSTLGNLDIGQGPAGIVADETDRHIATRSATSRRGVSERAPISLRLLGGLDMETTVGRDSSPVLSQPKRVALLVALACRPDHGFLRRDTLTGLLWPEMDQDRSRHALRQSLYVLRKALGKDLIEARGDDEVGIRRGVVTCDAAEFEREAKQDHPQIAMSWYNGDLLPGFFLADAVEFERWLETERVRLRRIAANCCWALAKQCEQAADPARSAMWARRAVDLAPFDEGAVHRLIALLDRFGDRAGAVSAYDHFARRLRDEYAAEPSPETTALIGRVRSRD